MQKFFFILMAVSVAIFARYEKAYAFAQGEQECIKCHTLSAEQAKDVLKEVLPDIKILDIQRGPVNGLWEIGMESGGRKGILYLDFAKKKLILGNIFEVRTKTNFTQDSFSRINKVDVSTFPYENSILMGDKDAKYKVVVFDDPD